MIRGLITSDIFKMSKILKKMGLKINTKETIKDQSGNEILSTKTQEQMGAELILSVFENIHLAEQEVNEFLADLASLTSEEFSKLPIEKTFEIIKELKNIPGLAGFLKQANQLTTTK